MRKMKKISALFLAVCMGTGILAGCSSGDTKKADTEKTDVYKRQPLGGLYSFFVYCILNDENTHEFTYIEYGKEIDMNEMISVSYTHLKTISQIADELEESEEFIKEILENN